jgi:hypothetical protein
MGSWKALAALGVAVAGAVAGFAIYTFGWHDDGRTRPSRRVITLRRGDVIVRPSAGTRCEASGEGGRADLFCTRLHGGRHQVIFYSDAVLVWPLERGPDGPPFSFRWTPYVLGAGRDRQFVGTLEFRDRRHAVTYADAIRAFGKATSCRLLGGPTEARAIWRSLGVRLRLSTLGGPPAGKNGCTAPRTIHIHSAYVFGPRWQTTRGLRVGGPSELVQKLYPQAIFQRRAIRGWPARSYWIAHVRERCVVGVCSSRYATSPRLIAVVRAERVAGFYFPVGAEGE